MTDLLERELKILEKYGRMTLAQVYDDVVAKDAKIAALTATLQETQGALWAARNHLDCILMARHLSPLRSDEELSQGILRLVAWEVKVALDPAVSTDALRLKCEGELGALKSLLEWYSNPEDEGDRAEIRRRIADAEARMSYGVVPREQPGLDMLRSLGCTCDAKHHAVTRRVHSKRCAKTMVAEIEALSNG